MSVMRVCGWCGAFTSSAASAHISGASGQADGRTERQSVLLTRTAGAVRRRKGRERGGEKMPLIFSNRICEEARKWAAHSWRLLPHLMLCLSLVAYAALGALMFRHIEGGNVSTTQPEYHDFLGKIVDRVQNRTSE